MSRKSNARSKARNKARAKAAANAISAVAPVVEACAATTGFGLRAYRVLSFGLGLSGMLLLGGGVLAAWTPSSAMTSGSYGAADVRVQAVDANGTTFSAGISNLLPGDYMYRYVDLTNSGTVSQGFTGSVSGTGTLVGALTVQIDTCSVSWSGNGTCSGSTSSLKAETSTASSVPFSFPTMAAAAVSHARFQFKLAANADQTTYQGTAATMTVNISGSSTVSGGQDRTAG